MVARTLNLECTVPLIMDVTDVYSNVWCVNLYIALKQGIVQSVIDRTYY